MGAIENKKYNPHEHKIGGEFGVISRSKARLYFLTMIEQAAPEVLHRLHDTVFSEYSICNNVEEVFDWNDLNNNPTQEKLIGKLMKWGKHYNLAARWVFDVALEIMRHWDSLDDYSKGIWKDRWVLDSTLSILKKHEPKKQDMLYFRKATFINHVDSFTVQGWNPYNTEWEVYQHYVHSMLEEYKHKVEKVFGEKWGQTEWDQEQAPMLRRLEHFNWAVMYQVLKYSETEIANKIYEERTVDISKPTPEQEKKANKSESNIYRAVRKVLKWVGLKPRIKSENRTVD